MQKTITLYSTLPPVGGNSTISRELCKMFLEADFKVVLLVRQQNYGYDRQLSEELTKSGVIVQIIGKQRAGLSDYFAPIVALILARFYRSHTFISIGMGQTALLIAKHGGSRKSFFYYINHDKDVSAVRAFGRKVGVFTGIIVISPVSIPLVKALIPSPRSVEWIVQPSEINQLPVDRIIKTRNRFGFVGSLNLSKGVKYLLDIWRENKDLGEIEFVGDGPLRSNIIEAALLDNRIIYGGKFSARDRDVILPQFFGRVDAVLVPSIGENEGIPTVILESLHCGCPVIASNSGGTAAFGEGPLAAEFASAVKLIGESDWGRFLSSPLESFNDPSEIREKYDKWFSNVVLRKKWINIAQ